MSKQMTLRRAQIQVRDGFNPRSQMEKDEMTALAASIKRHGILTPLIVRPNGKAGTYFLVGGHRRLAAADQAGIKTGIPAVVREKKDEDELAIAVIDNKHRVDLTPLEEARAFGRLREQGLTVKGVAEELSIAQRLITERLRILELPPKVQEFFGDGTAPTSAVKALADMAKVSTKLCELVALDVAKGKTHDGYGPQRTFAHLAGGRAGQIAYQVVENTPKAKQMGLFASRTDNYWSGWEHAALPTLEEEAEQQLAAISGAANRYQPFKVRFSRAELDAARAAGVLYENDGHFVVCDTATMKTLAGEVVLREHKAWLKAKATESRQKAKTAEKGPSAQEKADETARAYQQAQEARGRNLDLGAALLKSFASVDLTLDLAKWLGHTLLMGNTYGTSNDRVADLAMRGLRYVLPQWQHEFTQKNGKTRITYPTNKSGRGAPSLGEKIELKDGASRPAEPHECNLPSLFWAWWNLANTPGEVLGRTLIAFAAAHYADQSVVAHSSRAYFEPFSHYGDGQARELLEKIITPKLPPSIKAQREQEAKRREQLHERALKAGYDEEDLAAADTEELDQLADELDE